jgi:hypothetical protein
MGAEGFAGRVLVKKAAAARKIFLGTIVAISNNVVVDVVEDCVALRMSI